VNTGDEVRSLLEKSFATTQVAVRDDSADHAGHGASGGHYAVLVVSARFAGRNAVERHRMVYGALESMGERIHALQIQALTPEEALSRGVIR
jgi:BolA family transcriptional regulator, general stress-responsive regulator